MKLNLNELTETKSIEIIDYLKSLGHVDRQKELLKLMGSVTDIELEDIKENDPVKFSIIRKIMSHFKDDLEKLVEKYNSHE